MGELGGLADHLHSGVATARREFADSPFDLNEDTTYEAAWEFLGVLAELCDIDLSDYWESITIDEFGQPISYEDPAIRQTLVERLDEVPIAEIVAAFDKAGLGVNRPRSGFASVVLREACAVHVVSPDHKPTKRARNVAKALETSLGNGWRVRLLPSVGAGETHAAPGLTHSCLVFEIHGEDVEPLVLFVPNRKLEHDMLVAAVGTITDLVQYLPDVNCDGIAFVYEERGEGLAVESDLQGFVEDQSNLIYIKAGYVLRGDLAKTRRSHRASHESGRTVNTGVAEAAEVINHEFAHLWFEQNGDEDADALLEKMGRKLLKRADLSASYPDLGGWGPLLITWKAIAEELGTYACTDRGEFVAELFAKWWGGVDSKLTRMFDRFIADQ